MSVDNISILGLALTIIALTLSVWQTLAASKQTKDLSAIADSLSTKYLDTFPGYIPYIGELLSRAKHEVLILTPLPQHGVYSAHEGWLNAKHALESQQTKNPNMSIRCVFSDKENQRTLLTNQFHFSKENWKAWLSEIQQIPKIEQFYRKFGNGGDPSELSFEEFIKLFEVAGNHELETTYKRAEVIEISHRPPLNMWVIDGKEAIFAISSTTSDYFVESFWTSDTRLINALINMHTEYFNQKEMKSNNLKN